MEKFYFLSPLKCHLLLPFNDHKQIQAFDFICWVLYFLLYSTPPGSLKQLS